MFPMLYRLLIGFNNEVRGPNPEAFGGDVFWSDDARLGTGTDNERFTRFVAGVNAGNTWTTLVFDTDETVDLTGPHTFTRDVSFVGPKGARGADLPLIRMGFSGAFGLNFSVCCTC